MYGERYLMKRAYHLGRYIRKGFEISRSEKAQRNVWKEAQHAKPRSITYVSEAKMVRRVVILLGSLHTYTYLYRQPVTLLILESCSIILVPWFPWIEGVIANKFAAVVWTNGPRGFVSTRDPDLYTQPPPFTHDPDLQVFNSFPRVHIYENLTLRRKKLQVFSDCMS